MFDPDNDENDIGRDVAMGEAKEAYEEEKAGYPADSKVPFPDFDEWCSIMSDKYRD